MSTDVVADALALLEADSSATSDWEEESRASSTQSLTESIMEHVYENGRRYHKRSKESGYTLPSDETEQDRLDMVHHMHLELLGGSLSTLKFEEDPANVLDSGCGTGIWALEFGDEHPGSQVIGVDLAPIQPLWTAPNVRFEIDDVEKPWTYPENYFNLIRSRHLNVSIKDWQGYIDQIYRHLAPGGYVELSEHSVNRWQSDDNTIPEDSCYHKYMDTLASGLSKLGAHPYLTPKEYVAMLEKAGFVDVKVHHFKVPLGTWPKNKKMQWVGRILLEIISTGAEAYGYTVMTQMGGFSDEEAKEIINETLAQARMGKQHAYYLEWYFTARKPE